MGQLDLMSIDYMAPTLEGVVLNGASGLLAQSFNAYRQKDVFAFDLLQIVQFAIYTAITTPPNYAFQMFLETAFPARIATERSETSKGTAGAKPAESQLSVRNTIIKFFLDQSLSATVNTAMYICLMGSIKGHSWAVVQQDLYRNFFSLLFASYRFFPFVCLLNFAVVPMEYRAYIGSAAGMIWGIFLSLRSD